MNSSVRLVSLLFAIVVVVAITFFYRRSKEAHADYYYGYYDNVSGLSEGSHVKLNGVKVGKVNDVSIDSGGQVKVTIRLTDKVHLPNGTVARLISSGIAGQKDIILIPGTDAGFIAPPGRLVTSRDTTLLENFSARIDPFLKEAKTTLKAVDSGLHSFNDLIKNGATGEFTHAVIRFDSMTHKYAAVSARIDSQGGALTKDLRGFNQKTTSLASKNKDLDSSIQQYDRKASGLAKSDMHGSVVEYDSTFTRLQRKSSALNKKDTDTTNTLRDLSGQLRTMNKSMQELKKDPPGISIFGGKKKKKK